MPFGQFQSGISLTNMNKKLAWIEATPNDLDTWKQYYSQVKKDEKVSFGFVYFQSGFFSMHNH